MNINIEVFLHQREYIVEREEQGEGFLTSGTKEGASKQGGGE